MSYTSGEVEHLLRLYQHMAVAQRLPARGDRLVTSRTLIPTEASFTATSRLRADLDRALRSQPLDVTLMAFMAVVLGSSSWNQGSHAAWRKRVASWWGTDYATITAAIESTVQAACAFLNGDSQTDKAGD